MISDDDFDMNIDTISEYYHSMLHPFDIGGEAEEERNDQFHEDIREQKRMMFQHILPLRV